MMGRGVKERTRDKVAEEERNKEKREAESDIKGDLHTQTAESNEKGRNTSASAYVPFPLA